MQGDFNPRRTLQRQTLRHGRVFTHIHQLRQRQGFRLAQRLPGEALQGAGAIDQTGGNRKRHRKFSRQGVTWCLVAQLGGQVVGDDLNMPDARHVRQGTAQGHGVQRIERAMVEAAARMQLEIVAHQMPLGAQAAHQHLGVKTFRNNLAKQRTQTIVLTREAALCQLQGQQAVAIAHACIHVAHQPTFEHGLLGRGCRQRRADVDGLTHGCSIQTGHTGTRSGRSHRAPGAVRVHGTAQRRSRPQPRPHLIAHHQGRQHRAGADLAGFAQCHHRRDHMNGRMAPRETIALVHFQKGACRAVDQGRIVGRSTPAQAHQRSAGTHRKVGRQGAHLWLGRTGHDGGQAVRQNPGHLLFDRGRQGFKLKRGCKLAEGIEIVHGQVLRFMA